MKFTVTNQNQALEPSIDFSQKQYIADLYDCEKTKYILEKRNKWLANQIYILSNEPPFEKSKYYKEYNAEKRLFRKTKRPEHGDTEADALVSAFPVLAIGFFIAIAYDVYALFSKKVDLFMDGINRSFTIFLIALGISIVLYIFFYFKIPKDNDKEYSEWLDSENKKKAEVEEYNKKLWNAKKQKYNSFVKETKTKAAPVIKMYNNERNELLVNLKKVNNTLNELYSLRVNGILCLHPNYRGLIPISIIYGYFDTGRCTDLQGHEGAYNLYEDERVKGLIINKLDGISKQLGQINSTMTYVASAIESCNDRLSSLENAGHRMEKSLGQLNGRVSNVSNQLGGISNQISNVEQSSANSAYYSEISARCSVFNTTYNLLKD